MGKFTNSFIGEESAMGFSITGGAKKASNNEGGRDNTNHMNNSIISDSSIIDDFSVAGHGGPNAL